MVTPEGQDPGDVGLVFVAHNIHTECCGHPPRIRNIDNPQCYSGYFENRFGEQFVFLFDWATKTGTVWGGDLGWDNPKAFTPALLEEALRSTKKIAAQIVRGGHDETWNLPVIDAALALGRLTGLTGTDEIVWLRACLEACDPLAGRSGK